MKYFLLVIMLASTSASASCEDFYPYGIPKGLKESTVRSCNIRYVSEFDTDCKIPQLVTHHLRLIDLEYSTSRTNSFRADPKIPSEFQATNSDYSRSGFDRGHLAPANDMKESIEIMKESFYYSNIVPQAPSNNRGVWKRIENHVHRQVKVYDHLTVITGSVTDQSVERLRDKICIPTYLFKVLLYPDNSSEAYLVPNTNEATQFSIDDFKVTQEYLESFTNIKFTPHRQLK